jgi:predicted phosphoribosyltransferase
MEREGEESPQAAGRALAAPLQPYAGPDVLVVGVSRGGILVGLEVARALGAPFEPLVIQTLSDSEQPEHTAGVLVEPDYVALNAAADVPTPVPEQLRSVVTTPSGPRSRAAANAEAAGGRPRARRAA